MLQNLVNTLVINQVCEVYRKMTDILNLTLVLLQFPTSNFCGTELDRLCPGEMATSLKPLAAPKHNKREICVKFPSLSHGANHFPLSCLVHVF